MKKIIKDYFSFSRKERNIAIALIIILAAVILVPYLYPTKPASLVLDTPMQALLDSLSGGGETDKENSSVFNYDKQTTSSASPTKSLFKFNPNTLYKEGWMRLGLKERTAQTVLNYRAKGGTFRKPEDIRKIYGMPSALADELIPYVVLGASENQSFSSVTGSKTQQQVDINTAAKNDWKALPGVGEVLSDKIMQYRDRLGGFVSVEQVKETYGLSSETFQLIQPYLRLGRKNIKTLSLNHSTEEQLDAHPYISLALAKAVVAYRSKQGPFTSFEQLKEAYPIDNELFIKLKPYLQP